MQSMALVLAEGLWMSKAVPMPRQWEPKPFLRADQPTMVYSSLDTLELVMVHSGGGGREIDGAVAGIRRTGRTERNNRKRGQDKMTTPESAESDSFKRVPYLGTLGSLVLSARLVYQTNPSSVSFIDSLAADPMNSQVCSLLPKKVELAMGSKKRCPRCNH